MQKTKRILWIDLARTIAILAVIVCHATEAVYGLTPESMLSLGIGSRIISFSLF